MMQRDIRETALYQEAEALHRALWHPGTGRISDAAEVNPSADGKWVVFSGTVVEALNGVPPTRICSTDLTTGETRVLTSGPNIDRLPKFSPDGRNIAFLSDRHKVGDFQLYLLDAASHAERRAPLVDGWVEYLHWSPDGKQILLGVAGYGADVSGGQGAITSKNITVSPPSWMPEVESGDESFRWRRVWIYALESNCVCPVGQAPTNIWEAVWCGNEAMAAVVSAGPSEGLWYTASLHIVDLKSGSTREVYKPSDQLGWPAASPSGKHLAVVEALCSDRWIVAGDLQLVDIGSGRIKRVHTKGVNIAYTEWRSDRHLLLAGHRDFETVVGLYDVTVGEFTEVWANSDVTTGGRYVAISGFGEAADCILVGEGYKRAPEIAMIRGGEYKVVKSLDLGPDQTESIGSVDRLSWKAPDGLDIHGWLLRPKGNGPYPLVMYIHGGPTSHWRPVWLGRKSAFVLMLLRRGYGVFYPNPRGSSGRGKEFVRHVLGVMGGADTLDYLSGLDSLVEHGIADPRRLGVTGGSYGGYMTSWLITQDSRFAAAVSVAPVTNFVSEHLTSNISHFVALFLADTYSNPGGKYFQRSPIMHAYKAKTPTLIICGALDRCTPPTEAVQFHNALLENGVTSVLVTYPEEGHGVRKFPAAVDYAARVVYWFQEYMGANEKNGSE